MTERSYGIGEVAAAAGVATSKLRYYDSIGLVVPLERVNGRRRYDSGALDRLTLIAAAQAVGFTLAEVRTLFESFPAPTPMSKRWQELAKAKHAELERQATHIQRMQILLMHLEGCTCANEAECATSMRDAVWKQAPRRGRSAQAALARR